MLSSKSRMQQEEQAAEKCAQANDAQAQQAAQTAEAKVAEAKKALPPWGLSARLHSIRQRCICSRREGMQKAAAAEKAAVASRAKEASVERQEEQL